MYVANERQLANAIMKNEYHIVLHNDLIDGVEKIKNQGKVVWKSVFSALVASAFFWGTASAWTVGILLRLPVILIVCGGVVFVTLGSIRYKYAPFAICWLPIRLMY